MPPRRGGPNFLAALLKTRSLIALLATTLLASCAVLGSKPFKVFALVKGQQPFCVYDLRVEAGTPNHLTVTHSKPVACNRDEQRLWAGEKFAMVGDTYWTNQLPSSIRVHYRREIGGQMKTAQFDVSSVKVSDPQWVSAMGVAITSTGVTFEVGLRNKNRPEGEGFLKPQLVEDN